MTPATPAIYTLSLHDALPISGGLPARAGEVKLWDVSAQNVARTITGHADCIYAVAFSPDGAMLATASYDKDRKSTRLNSSHVEISYAVFCLKKKKKKK